jgi:uncharacterized protein YbjT (DUF2867 family)
MRYVITGGSGHISKPITVALLAAGHQVKIIGRNAEHLKELTSEGAEAAIGSVEDREFLAKAFAEADVVYTMVPPNFGSNDLKEYIARVGKNYAYAIRENKIKFDVNLSSIGAHMPHGAGPVSGLYQVEQALNALPDTTVLHLRPAYFYYNLFGQVPLIKNMNLVGSNFGGNNKLVMTDPKDIAEVAIDTLLKLDFKGKSVRYIASDERTSDEIALVLGSAIGKPDLKWVVFSDEQAVGGMIQAGLPEEMAKNYGEMGNAIQSGEFSRDYWEHRPKLSKTKLEDFASQFAEVFQSELADAH